MEEELSVSRLRFRRALTIVFCICICISFLIYTSGIFEHDAFADDSDGAHMDASAGATPSLDEIIQSGSSFMRLVFEGVSGGESIESVLAGYGFKTMEAKELPEWFLQEIGTFSQSGAYMANEDLTLIGAELAKDRDESILLISENLTERGWILIDSEMDGIKTFVKEEGEARWLLLECAKIGNISSAVLHIERV